MTESEWDKPALRFSLRVLFSYIACWAVALATAAPVVRAIGSSWFWVTAIIVMGAAVGRLWIVNGREAGLTGAAWGAPIAILIVALTLLGLGLWLR